MIELVPMGDRAFLARFADESAAASWAGAVRARRLAGVVDVVVAYRTAAVYGDPERVDIEALGDRLRAIRGRPGGEASGTLHHIPVRYDGLDLGEVSQAVGLDVDALVAAHHEVEYQVFAVGFLPGFPYAGYLPRTLSGLPRRASPRTVVPAGSVAIVGKQTGIYPTSSPGGWHLIGRTPLTIVDPQRDYFPIRAGDRLRFVPIDRTEFDHLLGQRL